MARRRIWRTSNYTAIALLALPSIPLIQAQSSSPSQTSPDSTTSTPTTLSTTTRTSSESSSSSGTDPPSSSSISTTSTTPSPIGSSNPTILPPPQTSQEIQQDNQDNGLVNSYFAILAILVLLIFLGIWLMHKRKKEAKARRITGRRAALARDMDGWAGSREREELGGGNGMMTGFRSRWGHWRNWSDGFAGTGRREEGLNERGEAPPAYSPRIEEEPRAEAANTEGAVEGGQSHGRVAIPLRTLSREEVPGLKPPEYRVVVNNS
ncbi:MAG: hypothetical protein M1820_009313 [Bogoriella megaspora]|nr:MAG: hypothetical protein M1820_009313 [Bogoriella megaspora]